MCHKCNYSAMLKESALEPTENRLRVLEIIGGNNFPLSAENIFNTVDRNHRGSQQKSSPPSPLLLPKMWTDELFESGKSGCRHPES